jgi:anaerobic selenocysteine-containing dehydrogenase
MAPTEIVSYCRICAAACGIVVTVDGDRVLKVRGDDAHPLSRGYTCSKGRGLADWHHSDARLDAPVLRGAPAGWDATLDDLGDVLRGLREEHGPDVVGVYVATGIAYDSAGQISLGALAGALGSGSFYSAATLDNAPVLLAAAMVTGSAALAPVWDPDASGMLLLVGTNPVVSHGYGTTMPDPVRRFREFRAAGGRLWVLDPRRSESAALADGHVALRAGSDVDVLAALARALLDDAQCAANVERECAPGGLAALRVALAPFTVSRAATAAGVDESTLHALLDALRGAPGRLAVLCGTGTTMACDGILVEWLRWVLLVLTGSLDTPGGMRFRPGAFGRPPAGRPWAATPAGPRSRPELPRLLGQLPAVAIPDEIEAGNLRALIVLGGNPAAASPQPDRVRGALVSLDALAVVDVIGGDTVDLATHVLPATGQLERADVDMNVHLSLGPGLRATRAIVPPGALRRPMWWILASLAARLGTDLLGGADRDQLDDETFLLGALAASPHDATAVFARGPRNTEGDDPVGWVRDAVLPEGRWHLLHPELLERLAAHHSTEPLTVPDLVLTPRREMAWSNSVRYGITVDEAIVRVHPDDAARHGVASGRPVRVASAHGSLRATVRTDDGIRVGTVSITHGRAGANAGALVSPWEDVDPLSTMPQMSGVAVTLAPDAAPEGTR